MKIYLEGVGLLGPGFADWPAARAVLAGREPRADGRPELPVAALLPAAERRRATDSVKLALAVSAEAVHAAGVDPALTPSVFASSGGDGATVTAILENLATDAREVSPTRFHNSVHNAPSGYWSIATGSRAAATSVCAFDASFAAGLLEAATQTLTAGLPVLLAAYDLAYPAVLHAVRKIEGAFGVGLVISPHRRSSSSAELRVTLSCDGRAPTTLADPGLEAMRLGNPAARALPLLVTLASGAAGEVVLEHTAGNSLAIAVRPLAA